MRVRANERECSWRARCGMRERPGPARAPTWPGHGPVCPAKEAGGASGERGHSGRRQGEVDRGVWRASASGSGQGRSTGGEPPAALSAYPAEISSPSAGCYTPTASPLISRRLGLPGSRSARRQQRCCQVSIRFTCRVWSARGCGAAGCLMATAPLYIGHAYTLCPFPKNKPSGARRGVGEGRGEVWR